MSKISIIFTFVVVMLSLMATNNGFGVLSSRVTSETESSSKSKRCHNDYECYRILPSCGGLPHCNEGQCMCIYK
ncbi:hypothetical protein HN51_000098 [Arachis hypogaea]|nr:uncharacterized protein DS421_1g01070 [Arachis hypogaea]